MKRNRKRLISTAAAVILFTAVAGLNIYRIQSDAVKSEADSLISAMLQRIDQDVAAYDVRRDSVAAAFDAVNRQKADTLAFMIREEVDSDLGAGVLGNYRSLVDCDNVIVVGTDRQIERFAISTPADFSDRAFDALTEAFEKGGVPGIVEAQSGEALYRYYGSMIDEGRMLVVVSNRQKLDDLAAPFSKWETKLAGKTFGAGGFTFAVSEAGDRFLYYPDSRIREMYVSDFITDGAELCDGYWGWINTVGGRLYCGAKQLGENLVVCAVPDRNMYGSIGFFTVVILFFFAAMIIVMAIYSYSIIKEGKDGGTKEKAENAEDNEEKRASGKHCAVNLPSLKKLLLIAALGVPALSALVMFMETLFFLGMQHDFNKEDLARVRYYYEQNRAEEAKFRDFYDRAASAKSSTAAYILDRAPQCSDTKKLSELSGAMGLLSLNLYDNRGTAYASDSGAKGFTLATDPIDPRYAIRGLLSGLHDVVAEPRLESGTYVGHAATVLSDEDGNMRGIVEITTALSQLDKTLEKSSITRLLSQLSSGSYGRLLSVSSKTGQIEFYSYYKMEGRLASEEGIRENQIIDGYSGYLDFRGQQLFAGCAFIDEHAVYAGVSTEYLSRKRAPLFRMITSVMLLCLFAAAPLFSLEGAKAKEDEDDESSLLEVILPDGTVRHRLAEYGGSAGRAFIKWNEKTPAQRVSAVLNVIISVFCGYVLLLRIYPEELSAGNAIISYIAENEWEKGFNIFAVTSSLMLLCMVKVIREIICFILRLFIANSDARGETVFRLLISLTKYITVLVFLYFCLAAFGVDTSTLVASAGILSLIIGLGAQDLIKDILAGLFIIFEEEYKVGDYVTVGDFTGIVREIGIRTTKLEGWDQNIKVINNNSISGVINRTQKFSFAVADIGIEYGESLERVEHILEKELPEMKKRIPDIVDGPVYGGVAELAESCVKLKISASCPEGRRIAVTRALNREIKMLFDRHGICIPFRQIVVNAPGEKRQPSGNAENEDVMPQAGEDRRIGEENHAKTGENI